MGVMRVSFTPRPFYLKGNRISYSLDRRLVNARAGMDAKEKTELCCPYMESNSDPSPPST
jgi:hypothetical protein